MKKICFALVFPVIIFASCATSPPQAGMTLDQAIMEAVWEIEWMVGSAQPGTTIAVLNFSSPSEAFSGYVVDEFTMQLLNGGLFTVVSRSELDRIRGELNFNMSGDVSDESAQHAARMLGAQVIVTGSLTEIAGVHRMTTRVLGVETAAMLAMHMAEFDDDARMRALLAAGAPSGTPSGTLARERSPVEPGFALGASATLGSAFQTQLGALDMIGLDLFTGLNLFSARGLFFNILAHAGGARSTGVTTGEPRPAYWTYNLGGVAEIMLFRTVVVGAGFGMTETVTNTRARALPFSPYARGAISFRNLNLFVNYNFEHGARFGIAAHAVAGPVRRIGN